MSFQSRKPDFQYRRGCRFCKGLKVDFKDPKILRNFVTEKGKIIPRRLSGNCAKHQRQITRAINRARNLALLPFTLSRR